MGLAISKQQLTEVFRNPFYCGILTHNLLEGEVVAGKHEKLITQQVFFQLNHIQAANVHGYNHQKYDNRFPLKNYLICASCGTHMTGYEVKQKGILYYKCNKIGCRVNKNANQLHAKYQELLKQFTLDPKLIAPLKEQLFLTFNHLNQQQEEEVKLVKSGINAIEQKLEKLEERYVLEGKITKEQYEKFSQKLKQEKAKIERQVPNEQIKLSNLEKYLEFSLKMCSQLASMWVSGDYYQRQKL